jgi:hypothetical protein
MGRNFAIRQTLQDAAAGNGAGTPLNVGGLAALGLQIDGTFVATVHFEGSVDGQNWGQLLAHDVPNAVDATGTTTAGLWQAHVSGLALVRARVGNFVSGTVTVYAVGTTAKI